MPSFTYAGITGHLGLDDFQHQTTEEICRRIGYGIVRVNEAPEDWCDPVKIEIVISHRDDVGEDTHASHYVPIAGHPNHVAFVFFDEYHVDRVGNLTFE